MIIGICGHKSAGKSTVCEVAINLARPERAPFVRMGFSDPLYQMLLAMGVPEDIVYNKSKWDIPLDILCGETTRFACDTLGNNWGRDTIGRDVWVKAGMRRATDYQANGQTPIIDNVRYWNEAKAVIRAGGVVVAFHRIGLLSDLSKPSECEIPKIQAELCKAEFYNRADDLEINSREFRRVLDAIVLA